MFDVAVLAYAGYLIWLAAGFLDFRCHRRTDLPHTSGLAESMLHLVQLALIGSAGLIGLLFEASKTIALILLVIVVVHAVVGYFDTRTAFGRRTLFPGEQHIHSVLDMATWIALACFIGFASPRIDSLSWRVSLRPDGVEPALWAALLIPALLLCGLPAVLEFRASWQARSTRPGATR